jgi:rhodanese-related sulfurtransferase
LTDQLLTFFHAHTALFIALIVALLALIGNEVHGAITGGKKLGPMEAVRLINDRDPLVVDVRAAPDFKKSHLLNALNVPLPKLDERHGEIGKDKSKPIIVYDALGGAAVEAAVKLRKLGFTEVYPLRGGINGWLGANLPVTAK